MWKLITLLILISNSASQIYEDDNTLDITNENRPLKCCPHGYGYNLPYKNCTELKEPFSRQVVDEFLRIKVQNASEYFHFNFGIPECVKSEGRVRMKSLYSKRTELRTDGKLYIEKSTGIPPHILLGPGLYCVDTFIFKDDNGKNMTSFDAVICSENDNVLEHYAISSSCMIISCVFILVTLAVYAWLPELRNLHGKVLMAYLMCLFVGFVGMTTMQILLKINNITVACCIGLTVVIYFSLLAGFFWLNVMCFDIWWTFSGKGGVTMDNMSVRRKFYAYSVYAFGIPTALTIILVSLMFSGLPPHPLLPSSDEGCFLGGNIKLFYLYGPIIIIWCMNIVFFVLTTLKIARLKKQIAVLKGNESAKHEKQKKERQRLVLYTKLFVVMGVNWVLEVVSVIYPKVDYIWCVTDSYNVLVGLIIFIIFVCKRKIFNLMKKRYMQSRGISPSRSQATARTFSR